MILISLCAIIEFDIEKIVSAIKAETFYSSIKYFDFKEIPNFFGIAFFSCECVGCLFVTRESMADKSKFKKIATIVTAIITLIYALFGTITALALGNSLKEIVFLGLEKERSYFSFF